MRIYLEVKNEKKDFKFADYVTFNVVTSYSPNNLWVLRNFGEEIEDGISSHNFVYRKVIAVMEVIAVIDKIEFHGKVVTIALGDFGSLMNIVINLGEENTSYSWTQIDNDFIGGYEEVYFIDLDDLKSSKEFADLSIEECFAKLLICNNTEYQLRNFRYILPSGRILNIDERYKKE